MSSADIAAYAAELGLDTTRVVLAGHSLGGDLAWAIALRNPTRIHGAVVMGSRASYRATAADHRVLAERGVRFAFLMGTEEGAGRRSGARRAADLLGQLGVASRWDDVPGGGHVQAPLPMLAQALGFVLAPR
jgi:pimeloyl-ACP methyl ester carboxylesterase